MQSLQYRDNQKNKEFIFPVQSAGRPISMDVASMDECKCNFSRGSVFLIFSRFERASLFLILTFKKTALIFDGRNSDG